MNDFSMTRLAHTLTRLGDMERYSMMANIDDRATRARCMKSSLQSGLNDTATDDAAMKNRLDGAIAAIYDETSWNVECDSDWDDVYVAIAGFCDSIASVLERESKKTEKVATWEFLAKTMVDCWASVKDADKGQKLLNTLVLLPKSSKQSRFLTDCLRQSNSTGRLERMSRGFSEINRIANTNGNAWFQMTAREMEPAMAHAMVASMPSEALRRQAELNVALRDIPEASYQRMLNEAQVGLALAQVSTETKELTLKLIAEAKLSPCDVTVKVSLKGKRPIIDVLAYQKDDDGPIVGAENKAWAAKVLKSIPSKYGVSISFACSGSGMTLAFRK